MPAAIMPEMQAMKDLVDDLPEVVAPDAGVLPFMTDEEMIAALRRKGYKIYKEVTL